MRRIAKWYRTRKQNIAAVEIELASSRGKYKETNRLLKNARTVPGVIVHELQALAADIAGAEAELEALVGQTSKAVDELMVKHAHEDLQRFVSDMVDAAHANQGDKDEKEKGGKK